MNARRKIHQKHILSEYELFRMKVTVFRPVNRSIFFVFMKIGTKISCIIVHEKSSSENCIFPISFYVMRSKYFSHISETFIPCIKHYKYFDIFTIVNKCCKPFRSKHTLEHRLWAQVSRNRRLLLALLLFLSHELQHRQILSVRYTTNDLHHPGWILCVCMNNTIIFGKKFV